MSAVVVMAPEELRAMVRAEVDAALQAHAAREAQRGGALDNAAAAALVYPGVDRSRALRRFDQLLRRHPGLLEAATGRGKLRRWDPARLRAALASLGGDLRGAARRVADRQRSEGAS